MGVGRRGQHWGNTVYGGCECADEQEGVKIHEHRMYVDKKGSGVGVHVCVCEREGRQQKIP